MNSLFYNFPTDFPLFFKKKESKKDDIPLKNIAFKANLYKKGKRLKIWTKRYYILVGNLLCYKKVK